MNDVSIKSDVTEHLGWSMDDIADVKSLLDSHVILDLSVPRRDLQMRLWFKLQVQGQVVYFLRDHRKMPIASPVIISEDGESLQEGRHELYR